MKFKFIVILPAVLFLSEPLVSMLSAQDIPVIPPEKFYKQRQENPHIKKYLDQGITGEGFCWHARYQIEHFLHAYQVRQDTSWLNWAVKYYDWLLSLRFNAPDGYPGWIGPHIAISTIWGDAQVSDAIMFGHMLEFVELVLKDGNLKKIYGDKADIYVAEAKKAIEKWDARKLWHEIGPYGDYLFGIRFMKPGDTSQWIVKKNKKHIHMSQKYNIANKLGVVLLKLYRITGEGFYRDKAEKLFFRMKSNFQHYDGHINWNYWVPYYKRDILFDTDSLTHWAGPHVKRPGYQSTETAQIVEAYNTGVVFSEYDIKGIIKTQLNVMWNQDKENPSFRISDGREPKKVDGQMRLQGSFWSSLKDFDPTIRELYERRIASPKNDIDKVKKAFYEKFEKDQPVSFKRKYAQGRPVIVKDVPLGDSKEIIFAAVIPHIIEKGDSSIIICKSAYSGKLKIELFSKGGKKKLGTLYQGEHTGHYDGLKGLTMLKWDGTHPKKKKKRLKGEYRVRWTLNEGYAEYDVVIKK